jgi:rRNA maturation endonuclease Nob1
MEKVMPNENCIECFKQLSETEIDFCDECYETMPVDVEFAASRYNDYQYYTN